MKKQEIAGYIVNNFGSNNYSYGMEAIIFNPNEITFKEVAKLPGVFLHPTVEPNSLEIFALLGTQEQYDIFYKSTVSAHCAKKAFDKFGLPKNNAEAEWHKLNEYVEELTQSFVPWYKEV